MFVEPTFNTVKVRDKVKVKVKVSKDGKMVGLTSILDRRQFAY